MKFTRLLVALFALTSSNLCGQELLSDSTFLAFFQAKTISLKEIKVKHNPTWMLVAGTCNKEAIEYSEDESRDFRLYADSVEGQKADFYTYDKEICDSRCKIAKFECLKRTLMGKGDAEVCDSLNEICLERCSEIKETRDNMLDDSLENVWNLHDFRYNYSIHNTFSKKKKGIPLRNHADSLKLCLAESFSTECMPQGYGWLIITKHRRKITTVDTNEKLLDFFGPIDSYPKAYLMLCAAGYTMPYSYPQETIQLVAKQTEGVFYFILRHRLPDCPEEEHALLVSVNSHGQTTLIEERLNFKQ